MHNRKKTNKHPNFRFCFRYVKFVKKTTVIGNVTPTRCAILQKKALKIILILKITDFVSDSCQKFKLFSLKCFLNTDF